MFETIKPSVSRGNLCLVGLASLAALATMAPTTSRAEIVTYKCTGYPEGKGLPETIVVDTTRRSLTYIFTQEDGVSPWSDLAHSAANISPDTITWLSDPAADAPRTYSLDLKSGLETVRWQENGLDDGQWLCKVASTRDQ